MRKYGRWLLVLGVMAACPAMSSAEGFLGGRGRSAQPLSAAGSQQNRSQVAADQVASALRDAQIDGYDIDVQVRNGVAVLNGKVRDASHRAMATQVARSVPGVRQVDNRLQQVTAEGQSASAGVQHAAASEVAGSRQNTIHQVNAEMQSGGGNQQAADQLATALSQAGLNGYDVEIRVNNGIAFLGGSVGTAQQRQMASDVASRVPGIRSVNNQLNVTSSVAKTSYAPASMPVRNVMVPPESMNAGMEIPQQAPQMAMSHRGAEMPPQMMSPQMMSPQMMQNPMMASHSMPPQMMPPQMMQASMSQPAVPGAPMAAQAPSPMGVAPASFSNPHLPSHAWPAYAQYPNSAAVSYPTQYSASAWPYIGPFYPYPQVPMGWREVSLEWDDGYWQLNFNKEKDKWYWILNPKSW